MVKRYSDYVLNVSVGLAVPSLAVGVCSLSGISRDLCSARPPLFASMAFATRADLFVCNPLSITPNKAVFESPNVSSHMYPATRRDCVATATTTTCLVIRRTAITATEAA